MQTVVASDWSMFTPGKAITGPSNPEISEGINPEDTD